MLVRAIESHAGRRNGADADRRRPGQRAHRTAARSTASARPATPTATGRAPTASAASSRTGPRPAWPPPEHAHAMSSFVDRHGLWSDDQHKQARELVRRIDAGEVDVVRFAWPDQHGLLRGKTLVASEAARRAVGRRQPHFHPAGQGHLAQDRVPGVRGRRRLRHRGLPGRRRLHGRGRPRHLQGAALGAAHGLGAVRRLHGRRQALPLATRQILQRAVQQLGELGLDFIAGLEVEFHVFKLEDPRLGLADSGQPGEPPRVSLLSHGHQYLTELRYDRVDAVMELLRSQLIALGLPLRSLEIEFGPSQFELTFGPTAGVLPADTMVLLRSAIKQICQRAGYHATFMCRPKIPNVMSSGWHLHQSLRRRSDGVNAFMPAEPGQDLSEHRAALPRRPEGSMPAARRRWPARPSTATDATGPSRWRRTARSGPATTAARCCACWAAPGRTRRGSRTASASRRPTRISTSRRSCSRAWTASRHETDPGPSADAPYETPAEQLPRSLGDALACLRDDEMLNAQMGKAFVDYLLPHQGSGDRPLQPRSQRVGTPRVLRHVLRPPAMPTIHYILKDGSTPQRRRQARLQRDGERHPRQRARHRRRMRRLPAPARPAMSTSTTPSSAGCRRPTTWKSELLDGRRLRAPARQPPELPAHGDGRARRPHRARARDARV